MKMVGRRCAAFILILSTVLVGEGPISLAQGASAWPDELLSDSAFYNVWSREDAPIAMRAAVRSWLWGPVPFAVANETYAESPTGKRLVTYLDKARMEVNDPAADRGSQWFVTSGLLVKEMVSGLMQTGNTRFEPREPAKVPVAGDLGNTTAPTYASFAEHTAPVPDAKGAHIAEGIMRDGSIFSVPVSPPLPGPDSYLFSRVYYDPVTGHNVAGIFREWMDQKATVLENGRLVQGQLLDPLYVLGRPLSEPYWADVPIKGVPVRVLVQLFERRALTYNPQNPSEWQVEMANVGRSYFEWRYRGRAVEPAISAELRQNAVYVRGWNWPAAQPVRVQIDLSGGATPLSGPQNGIPDTTGRFFLTLPLNPQLQGALLSGANITVSGTAVELSVALPFAARNAVKKVQLEGELSQVSPSRSPTQKVVLTDRGGKAWSLSLAASTKLIYSEGVAAGVDVLRSGMAVSVEGAESGGDVSVTSLRLMSVSRTGASFGYDVQPDEKSLRISGKGWPAEKGVVFSLRTLATQADKTVVSLAADSRGNVLGSVQLPARSTLPEGALWLFAMSTDKGAVLAQVALLFEYPAGNTQGPPTLTLLGATGEQIGGVGSYCTQTMCVDKIGVPLPPDALKVASGEVLGLRSQYGPDPNAGITPTRFVADLYVYPDIGSNQGTLVDGIFYFRPGGAPLYTTGQLPGRPFSISLPNSLAPGKYAVVVFVGWPDGDGSYGFTLEVGGR
ncbi:MAG TPA: hypothetical protein VJ183_03120 [Chloroflexia bacterium]|nr:hypothetical protein [Chloroflexia bacterium]